MMWYWWLMLYLALAVLVLVFIHGAARGSKAVDEAARKWAEKKKEEQKNG